ncbi:MAG: hydrogenase maturation nickel metallochaperone HypA [Bacteroidales bacterium]
MHELSIVSNIFDIVEENAVKHQATIVHEIEVDVGELAGIEFDALEFALENAPRGKILKDSRVVINKIQPKARCEDCCHVFVTTAFAAACPRCTSSRTKITSGHELKIKSFRMD